MITITITIMNRMREGVKPKLPTTAGTGNTIDSTSVISTSVKTKGGQQRKIWYWRKIFGRKKKREM